MVVGSMPYVSSIFAERAVPPLLPHALIFSENRTIASANQIKKHGKHGKHGKESMEKHGHPLFDNLNTMGVQDSLCDRESGRPTACVDFSMQLSLFCFPY
jgi:hypothetical protein